MLKPGIDDLAFIGLGQPIPTIFPFSELQSKLAARWLSGDWAPPQREEMEREIRRDEAFHTGHFTDKPRHTMQLEWYGFEHELKTRSIPAGQARARAGASTGRAAAGRAEALLGVGGHAMSSVAFDSGGVRCAGVHLRGEGDAFADGDDRRPCVVMAHGFAATVDSGLMPFAERFAKAGLDALVFDYRHFGASDGEPRQLISIPDQLADYAAAIAFARTLDGVDPSRVVVWGSSFSGGHVVPVAVADGAVAAAISQVPSMDGVATMLNAVRRTGPLGMARLTARALRDLVASLRGRPPVLAPAVAAPGGVAFMTTPDAEPGMRAVAGPSWRNEVAARIALALGAYRPGLKADRLPCPMLVQIADRDSVAPPQGGAGRRVARDGSRRGAHVPDWALRHLHRSAVRAGDRRPAALPAPAPRRAGRNRCPQWCGGGCTRAAARLSCPAIERRARRRPAGVRRAWRARPGVCAWAAAAARSPRARRPCRSPGAAGVEACRAPRSGRS